MMKAKNRVCTIIFLGIILGSWSIFAQEPTSVKKSQTQIDSTITINQEPGINDSVEVEKEPGVDLNRLTSLVFYPEDARMAGVEGKVVLRALINKDGSLRKLLVEFSDNVMLNESAKNAVKSYGLFEPAIQKGKPIACWVSIPIKFKLSDVKLEMDSRYKNKIVE